MMTNANTFTLSGVIDTIDERTVGPRGTPLVELRVTVTRTVRGESQPMTIPIIVWDRGIQALVRDLSPGTDVLVNGRIGAKGWTGRDGSARCFVEVVAEQVGVTAAPQPTVAPARPRAAMPPPPTPRRPSDAAPF